MTADQGQESATTMQEVLMEGCRILAFIRGGEKRLCMPQVVGRVLSAGTGATPIEILAACNLLGIQSTILFIRQSDAERLFKCLLASRLPRTCCPISVLCGGIAVKHRCFGKQSGMLFPRYYTHPGAGCIVCAGCSCMMGPEQFVGHAHGELETRNTCHWGFDSANWRLYLTLDRARAEPQAAQALESVKTKVWLKRASSMPIGGHSPRRRFRDANNSFEETECCFELRASVVKEGKAKVTAKPKPSAVSPRDSTRAPHQIGSQNTPPNSRASTQQSSVCREPLRLHKDNR